jgi:aspartokinase/homoserine dehydrogenase 2
MQSEQGSTSIERALVSGTDAKIISSHDDIYLIEQCVASQHDFKLAKQELYLVFKLSQIKPPVIGVRLNRNLVQVWYTS